MHMITVQKLSQKTLTEIEVRLKEKARSLEISLFEWYFRNGSLDTVLRELKVFQNSDGGFGHAIEPDFRLTFSSPMGTSVGFQILYSLDCTNECEPMIKEALEYIEESYKPNRKGWVSVPPDVNNYPHTPWWHYDAERNASDTDEFWGNPSAELIGYLYNYRNWVQELNVDKLIHFCETYVEQKQTFRSEHELYCFARLCNMLPAERKTKICGRVKEGVQQLIHLKEDDWAKYVPGPLDFVPSPKGDSFGIQLEDIERHLNFFVQKLNENLCITPSWGNQFYQTDLRDAYNEWVGILTLQALQRLAAYNRIETP